MVSVPKDRYQKLIDIYSWNIAEITVSQMLKLNNPQIVDENVESPINYVE